MVTRDVEAFLLYKRVLIHEEMHKIYTFTLACEIQISETISTASETLSHICHLASRARPHSRSNDCTMTSYIMSGITKMRKMRTAR